MSVLTFRVLAAVKMSVSIFGVLKLWTLVEDYRRFGAMFASNCIL
jgi:hypothetical protein